MAIDWTILNSIQDIFQCEFLDAIMPKLTLLGSGGFIWIAIAVCMMISQKYRKTGILMLIGMLLGLIIGNGIIKNLVQRDRPCWIDSDFHLLIKNPKDYSFPSGHTLASTISAIIITINHKKLGIIVIPLAAIIAFSRMYLYVHFPTDILGGIILGTLIAVPTALCGRKILQRYSI